MENHWADVSPVQSEKAVQVGASRYGGKDLWKRWVLSLEWNSECVMEGESGEYTWPNFKKNWDPLITFEGIEISASNLA